MAPFPPPPPQVRLADEATRMLHGESCLEEIRVTAASLFSSADKGGGGDTSALPRVQLQEEELGDEGIPVVDLFVRLELGKSKSEVRRLVAGGGARLNGVKIDDPALVLGKDAFEGSAEVKLSSGKKKHGIVQLVS